MTCYFRHLKLVLQKAGIEITKENRREVDKIIRNILDAKHEGCPEAGENSKSE